MLQLLKHYEELFICVPNARANLLPMERVMFFSCKIVCAGNDWSRVVSNVRELLVIIETMGVQRFFNLPYMLELVLERLFDALQLANEAAQRPNRVDPIETFVAHNRGEINGTWIYFFFFFFFFI